MTTLEPQTAMRLCEQALRDLMHVVYPDAYGRGWVEEISTAGQRRRWAEAADAERGRLKRGAAILPEDGLEYSQLFDLVDIARKHWDPLRPALGPRSETLPLLERAKQLRNCVAHNRTALAFEADLLSGISGQIRNQVTLFMSSQDPAGEYYPRIESVMDSLGHPPSSSAIQPEERIAVVHTGAVLRPGDVVTYTCRGLDPQGRGLSWSLKAAGPGMVTAGESVILRWEVTDHDVNESREVLLLLSGTESRFHRWGMFDQGVMFVYSVRPPELRQGA